MTTPGIPNDFVLSTSCFGTRLTSIQDQIFAAVGMGFRRLELGLTDAPPSMDGLEDSQRETGATLRSLVAGCRDARSRDISSSRLSSSQPEERERALNSVRRHVRLAQAWGCNVVVLRGSRIEDQRLLQRVSQCEAELAEAGSNGKEEDSEAGFERVCALAAEVQRVGQRQIESLCRSLHTLMGEAPDVHFALEPGKDLDDLLGFEAMGWVLEDLSSHNLGYWHDVGRIHLRESMGLPGQGAWLDAYAPKMIGIHLQDASRDEPELPLGTGEVDFKLVAEYTPKEAERVIEIHPRHGRAEILTSVRFLLDHGF